MAATEASLQEDLKFMDRNSRMIGAFGLDVIAKMVGMKVLIVGCKGVGIEVAKNTVLAGVHTLTLFDPEPATARDMGTNFFIQEADLGKPRAAVCAPRVGELNANVLVQAGEGAELTEALVSRHTIVVFTRGSHAELVRWNHFCRTQTPSPLSFLSHYGGGAWGGVFVDHGDAFTIRDANGRAPLIKLIKGIEVKDDHLLIRYDTPDGQPPACARARVASPPPAPPPMPLRRKAHPPRWPAEGAPSGRRAPYLRRRRCPTGASSRLTKSRG